MREEPHFFLWAGALRALALGLALFLALAGLSGGARAQGTARTLIPVGKAVGIKMFSDGVMVVGLSQIPTDLGDCAPARDCGLQQGDIITHINSTQVDTIEEVQVLLQVSEGEPVSLRANRGERELQLTAQAALCSDGTYKLGAWIRDSMAGIGTVTYFDPATGRFATLGHSINDVDTSLLMPLESGAILPATVEGVTKGVAGTPGQLQGHFDQSRQLGALYANTPGGVFGTTNDPSFAAAEPLPVAAPGEVKVGPATILSNVSGDTVAEYDVEITRLCADRTKDTRQLMLKVIDPDLLAATGGIVQGMSGSPILQNGKIVGAVTHVLISDPTQGYGILATTMLDMAEEN